jgi:hypothetical protein
MDATKRKDARKTFCKHIDNVISASYGPDLSITHRCIDSDENEQMKIGTADDLFREKDASHFHRARHKELYDEIKGGIMYCPDCKETMTTIDGPEGRSCCVGRVEPLRSLLPVRYGKVKVMKNVLVPTIFLQVRESSRCPYCRLRYGST